MAEPRKYMLPALQTMKLVAMYGLDPKSHIIWKILFVIWRCLCTLTLIVAGIQSFLYVYTIEKFDMEDCASSILNIAIFIGGTVRIVYFSMHCKQSAEIVQEMDDNFLHKMSTVSGEENVEKYESMSTKVVRFWQINVPFTANTMAIFPLFFIFQTGRVLPAKLWYPFDWIVSPYYEVTIATQIFTQNVIGFVYANSDVFYVSTTILTTGQFDILGKKLKNCVYTALLNCGVDSDKVLAFSRTINKYSGKEAFIGERADLLASEIQEIMATDEFNRELQDEFANCVKMHQFLIHFCELLETFMSPVFFPIILLAVFFLTFMAYGIVTYSARMLLSLAAQFFTVTLQLFILTFFGQLLTNMSEELFHSFYQCPWYMCNSQFKKGVLIAQINLAKPVILTAGKLMTFQLPTFLSAMRTFVSYFTVLRQVSE